MKPCPKNDGRSQFKFLNRPDDGTCDWCGSLDGDVFMARLETGDVMLVPTDKNYKVYVKNAGGQPFKQTYRIDDKEERRKKAAENAEILRTDRDDPRSLMSEAELSDARRYAAGEELDWGDQRHWKWKTDEVPECKFYFQHLTEEQRQRFVELLNARKLKLDYPGYFYRLPYFVVAQPQTAKNGG